MHRLLPHTADLRAELAAPDFAALCGEAVELLRTLLVRGEVSERSVKSLRFEGGDEAERFFRFVRELVYLADSEGFLPATCDARRGGVELRGEAFDAQRHVPERQIKALTRHRFRFERLPGGGLRVEMVFDL
jgi:SHS2 domain-containing protein